MGKVHVHHNINTCAVNPYGEEEPRDSFLAKIAPNGRVPTLVRATNLHGYTATARIHGLFFVVVVSIDASDVCLFQGQGYLEGSVASPDRQGHLISDAVVVQNPQQVGFVLHLFHR